VVELVDTLP